MADPDHDPNFQADPNPLTRARNFFLQIFNYCFQSLPKLVMCNFLSKNAEGRVRMRGEGGKVRKQR